MADEIIDFYKKAKEPEEPQKPIEEQKETPVPEIPKPDEPFDRFLLELAEKLQKEKVITEKQQETFVEQIKEPVSTDPNENDPFKKFIGSFANILREDELVNREENIKEATISFINKLKEQPEEPFIIQDEILTKSKKQKYLPPKIAKKVQKLPQPVKKEEPVVAEQADEPVKEEPKDENSYVKELKTADKTNKKITEKIKSVSDIKSIVEKQVAEILSRYPNLGFTGGGGGTNAVQYAKGGTMDGDLNVTGKFLSGGVDISTLFGSGGGTVSGIPDRLIAGSETLRLYSNGTIDFPNDTIRPPDETILTLESENLSLSSYTRIALSPYAFFVYDNEGNSITFDEVDNAIVLTSKDLYEWTFNQQGVLVGPNGHLTVNALSSLGRILSGGKDLLEIFALSGTGGGGGTGRDDVNTVVIENSASWIDTTTVVQNGSANWDTAYNAATVFQTNSGNYILDGGNSKGSSIFIGTTDNYNIYFNTNSNTRAVIDTAGNLGIGVLSPTTRLEVDGTITTTSDGNSVQWNTAYNTATALQSISGNYLSLSGGTVIGDVTITGNLTALGTTTFQNTVFTTASTLSVINTGPGPALYVYQSSGPYDVASFYDGDGIEVLHVGNANPNGLGRIGINESFPNLELTVRGSVSATGTILASAIDISTSILSAGVNLLDILTDDQVLIFNEASNLLSISNGNSVSLSAINSTFASNSGKYESVYTNVQSNSANWQSAYNSIQANSANWNNAYNTATVYQANSSSYATTAYTDSTYLPLSGGTLTGNLSVYGNTFINNNLTIGGNLTALGTTTFANTVFTTTSSLSVVNTGPGPALYVFQAAGPYDVASFYDGDGIEVLHVGNAGPGGLGKVGVNESFPNEELTVRGSISATETIYANSYLSAGVDLLDIFSGGGGGGGATPIKRFDYVTVSNIDYSYSGSAAFGTLDTSPTWKLIRLTYANNGTISNSASAINSWTGRLTAAYI